MDLAVEAAAGIDRILDEAEVPGRRLHHGVGLATWKVIARALPLGHDVRIGLEDTLVLPDGRKASDNADLVRAARRMANARR